MSLEDQGADMEFMVIAHDDNDAEAPARRARVRDTHLALIQPYVDRGQVLIGGAMLDAAGGMVGSCVLCNFDSRDQLDDWLQNDPYVTHGVWKDVDVVPFRTAVGAWARPLPD
jgi:uncharacterized protein